MLCASWLPSLSTHVVVVIGMRPKEKVIRVYAEPRIAFMAHQHPIWDGAMRGFKRNPMCRAIMIGSISTWINLAKP